MSACYTLSCEAGERGGEEQGRPPTHVWVAVDGELLAAVEGWRQAHALEQSEAISELLRLGLMSEIAKIYRLVSDKRPSANDKSGERRARSQG